MDIPRGLQDSVLKIFGPEGRKWLARLPELLHACREKWKLSRCTLSADLSINLVCFAMSPDFGSVVLKVGVLHPEYFTEVRALQLYGGSHVCRCYDDDADLGAMLLERVVPGHTLATRTSASERVAVAADLGAALLRPMEHDGGFPLVSDLAHRAFRRLRGENRAGPRMLSLADASEPLFGEVDTLGRGLLHGDLHHHNILESGRDTWKAIDPKGQIGPPAMQVARFMINELDRTRPSEWGNCLNEMIAVFGARLGVPEHEIALCAFLDRVLSTSWKYEEHLDSDKADDLDQAEFLMKYWSERNPHH